MTEDDRLWLLHIADALDEIGSVDEMDCPDRDKDGDG